MFVIPALKLIQHKLWRESRTFFAEIVNGSGVRRFADCYHVKMIYP